MLQLDGGNFTPQTDFYCHALKPLGVVRNALVTFPRYAWPKNAVEIKKYLCSFFQYGGWKTDTQPQNDEKFHVKCYLVF